MSCNRIRLTSDGKLRNCLFSLEETDVRALLRGGATDAEIAQAIRDSRRLEMGRARDQYRPVHPARAVDALDRRLNPPASMKTRVSVIDSGGRNAAWNCA